MGPSSSSGVRLLAKKDHLLSVRGEAALKDIQLLEINNNLKFGHS